MSALPSALFFLTNDKLVVLKTLYLSEIMATLQSTTTGKGLTP